MACGARSLATLGVVVVIVMLVASLLMTNSVTPGPAGWSPRLPWAASVGSSIEGMSGGGCGCKGGASALPIASARGREGLVGGGCGCTAAPPE